VTPPLVAWKEVGSLILAVPDHHDDFQHAGGVGTGLTEHMLDHLAALLAPLRQETSPFPTPLPCADTRDAVCLRAELVAEVACTEWTSDGHHATPPGEAHALRSDQNKSAASAGP
jgi:ATP-dependent DNA ligase